MRFLWAAIVSVCIWLCAIGQSESPASDLEQLLKDGRVLGLSFAIIRDAKSSKQKLWVSATLRQIVRWIESIATDAQDVDQHIAWGLGWGLEPDAGSFFHWGNNPGFKAFVTGSLTDRSAVVVFTNGDNGMAIIPDVINQLMPGDHPAFKWLDQSRNMSGALLEWFRVRWHQWVY